MNAPAVSAPLFDQAYLKKARCENRWTAAEDRILFAQVLKGGFPNCRQVPALPLTFPKPTVARSAGDPWLPHCQEGTINPVGRGAYPLSFSFSSR